MARLTEDLYINLPVKFLPVVDFFRIIVQKIDCIEVLSPKGDISCFFRKKALPDLGQCFEHINLGEVFLYLYQNNLCEGDSPYQYSSSLDLELQYHINKILGSDASVLVNSMGTSKWMNLGKYSFPEIPDYHLSLTWEGKIYNIK